MLPTSIKRFLLLGLVPASVLTGSCGWSQTASGAKPPLYTYISEWTVPRGMWADYIKSDAVDAQELSKSVSSGTLVSEGSFVVLNHQEGQPTHGNWFAAKSMASLMNVLEQERTAPASTGPTLAASKHWDYIMVSRDYGMKPGNYTNGYLRVMHWERPAGGSDPDSHVLRATIVPMLEKMLADGSIHSYQIDQEIIHSSDPGSFFVVMVTNGPEGLDKFNDLLEQTRTSNPEILAAYGSMIDSKGHWDTLARVSSMSVK